MESNAPVFSHGDAFYWVGRAIAPERLPQLLDQAKLEVYHHIQDGLVSQRDISKTYFHSDVFTNVLFSDINATALSCNVLKRTLNCGVKLNSTGNANTLHEYYTYKRTKIIKCVMLYKNPLTSQCSLYSIWRALMSSMPTPSTPFSPRSSSTNSGMARDASASWDRVG